MRYTTSTAACWYVVLRHGGFPCLPRKHLVPDLHPIIKPFSTAGGFPMNEAEWLSAPFAFLWRGEAETIGGGGPARAGADWGAVAAGVACLRRLGPDMPGGVRRGVGGAAAYLARDEGGAPADEL